MKNLLTTLALLLIGFTAHAGSQVCAGKTLYYSSVRNDLGTKPPPGIKIGSLTIVADAKVLLKRDEVVGLGQYSINNYQVELSEEAEVIQSTGNEFSGSSISKLEATLYKVSSVNPSDKTKIKSEEVVCQKIWRMAY